MISIPSEVITFAIAMIPVIELRGAIPFAVGVLGLSVYTATIISYFGSLVPFFLIYILGNAWLNYVNRHESILSKITKKWTKKASRVLSGKKYEKYGLFALLIFISIPLPVTGVWTGSLAAFLFGLSWRKSLPYVAVGAAIAGIIVALVTVGAFTIVESIFVSDVLA